MNNTKRLAKIDDLLGGLPQFKCVEGCSACCGPIGASRLEWKRIVEVSGRNEQDIRKEASKNMALFEQTGQPNDLRCPMLSAQGKCTVYEVRPAICQLFGVVNHERLECPHGGVAERKISNDESIRILNEIDRLGF